MGRTIQNSLHIFYIMTLNVILFFAATNYWIVDHGLRIEPFDITSEQQVREAHSLLIVKFSSFYKTRKLIYFLQQLIPVLIRTPPFRISSFCKPHFILFSAICI